MIEEALTEFFGVPLTVTITSLGSDSDEAEEEDMEYVPMTEYETLLAQINANQAALDEMESTAVGAAIDIAQWDEDVQNCAADILATDSRRALLSHEEREFAALERENAELRAQIKQTFTEKYKSL